MGKKFQKHFKDENGKVIVHKMVGMIIMGIVLAIIFALAFSFLVQYLWNTVLASVFSIKQITFWQAFAIIILSKILFGGFGKHGHCESSHTEKYDSDSEFKKDVKGKWKEYKKFWKEEGRECWRNYCDKIEEKDEE